MKTKPILKICPAGHRFYKSSDCNSCPVCEKAKNPVEEFLSNIGAPARRALQNAQLDSLQRLKNMPDEELLKLHGFGKAALARLRTTIPELSKKSSRKTRDSYTLSKQVDDYIEGFPARTKTILKKIRKQILQLAPEAEELISYGMPAYKLNNKPLVYFAGYQNHIGFYATPTGHEQFKAALTKYKQGKGSVQFPLSGAFPYDLIGQIVKFRIEENKSASKT